MRAARTTRRTPRSTPTTVLTLLLLVLAGGRSGQAQDDTSRAAQRLRDLYFLRDYEMAVAEGVSWRERAPDALEPQAWYALNLARDDQVDEAIAEAESLVAADSTNPWSWFALAGALNWHGERGEEALDASEKALALSPDDIHFVWLRADVIRKQNGNEASIEYMDGLPADFQGHALLLVRKAVALEFMASEQENDTTTAQARAVFERARQADPLNLEAWYLPGAYLLNTRRIDEACPLLRRAADLTLATRVHSDYWQAVQARQDLSLAEKRAEIEADLEKLLRDRGHFASTIRAAASGYRDIGEDETSKLLEDYLLEVYPESREAEWVLVERYRAVGRELNNEKRDTGVEDPEKRERYRGMLVAFIERPHHSEERLLGDAYRSLFHLIKDDPAVDGEYLYEVVDGMVQHEDLNPQTVYGAGAIALAEHKTHLEEAEQLTHEGIEKAREQVDEMKEMGVFDTDADYNETLGWYMGIMYDALGWVHFNGGRLDEAEAQLLHAYELSDKIIENLHHLGRLNEARYDLCVEADSAPPGEEAAAYLEQAEEYYIQGVMVQSFRENPNEGALKVLYERRHGSLDGYDDYLANIEAIDRERRHRAVLDRRIEEPKPYQEFDLNTLAGTAFSSSDLESKIVVINFWGTWCGPCVIEMPEFQKFHERYRDDPDVVVLTINNDTNPDDVREWMAKYGYDFAVLLDDGYVDAAGIRAFPTTLFIDREGRIAFQKVGASESLAEEFGWRVEALKGTDGE